MSCATLCEGLSMISMGVKVSLDWRVKHHNILSTKITMGIQMVQLGSKA